MKIEKIFTDAPNQKVIDNAIDCIDKGNIIIIPTDSVYAFACDALNNSAIEKICSIKAIKSDRTNLSIICCDIAQASEYARIDNATFKMMRKNLPGPITFILPALNKLPKAFKGRKTVGIRIPATCIITEMVRKLGHPIMVSSIPVVDFDNDTEPELIAETYDNSATLIIDFGRGGSIPSTVVDCTEGECTVIRQGNAVLTE
ncbi:MAG: L-threonylcarbamoyladenylate synthase [Muribaculaceae bacterium]|nr:L-threonylcarbamoyladenylate synthase [Muribaculaceae bacterium]